ncbi:MAG: hypothetical protein J0I42_12215 [Bosea sp.]|uniref:hypothetical protein n=1 Tax=Bosea sp. (in: a-proteobacteria) TaxID=1871050 RepID=UPI001AC9633A|nr:hypothetical protein [Bosea sp. (in: a-proteobacteria)]MBN9452704.1 hypothetical protein [Bosea sp. (in: a-proteobacteria)]
MDSVTKEESERLIQQAYAEAFAEGVALGRARFKAIMRSDEAKANTKLALYLAMKTDLPADVAVGCLGAASEDHPSPAVLAAVAEAATVAVLQ